MVALIEQFGCDGCAFGLVSKDNQPLLQPWRIVTSSKRLAANLSAYRCQHARGFRYAPVEGSESRKSAVYPEPMARVIIASLFPFAKTFVAPALSYRPSMPQAHRDNDAHPLKPINGAGGVGGGGGGVEGGGGMGRRCGGGPVGSGGRNRHGRTAGGGLGGVQPPFALVLFSARLASSSFWNAGPLVATFMFCQEDHGAHSMEQ